MLARFAFFLMLTLSALAREVVILRDGSRGVVLQRSGQSALVGLTRLRQTGDALDRPVASRTPISEIRSTQIQAEGMAVLIDPKPPTNLRSAPNGAIVRRLDGHSALILLEHGEWHKVMTGDGAVGYVHSSTVSVLTLEGHRDELESISRPLIEHHKKYCASGPAEGRRLQYLSVDFGPLGRVVANPKGEIVLREDCSQELAGGFSQDGQWLAVTSNLVNRPPPYWADYPASKRLYHKVGGKFQLVLDVDFYNLDLLHKKQVPDAIIRGLCLPYPKNH
ncbi:MAG: SH3 domain-containing protein [Vulcanimicrobiota bacterium]